jgi:hypothetical protein
MGDNFAPESTGDGLSNSYGQPVQTLRRVWKTRSGPSRSPNLHDVWCAFAGREARPTSGKKETQGKHICSVRRVAHALPTKVSLEMAKRLPSVQSLREVGWNPELSVTTTNCANGTRPRRGPAEGLEFEAWQDKLSK